MIPLHENAVATPTGDLNERTFAIEIIPGGSMADMAGMLARRKRTQVIRVDSPEVLRHYEDFDRRKGIKQLPLGERETLETLFQGVSGPLAEVVRNVAPMDARDGCGGSPAAGYRGTELLIRLQDTIAYFESLISRIVAQTGARPECIHVNIHASYAGGTGAG